MDLDCCKVYLINSDTQVFKLLSWLWFHCDPWCCGKLWTNVAVITVAVTPKTLMFGQNCGCRLFFKTIPVPRCAYKDMNKSCVLKLILAVHLCRIWLIRLREFWWRTEIWCSVCSRPWASPPLVKMMLHSLTSNR